MALTSQYTDTTEPVADTDAEAATNQHLYGVISGCAVTFDATDMTYDVAAGTILHNGSVVSVAAQANAGTLTADGTNPRWATVYLDSSGVEGLVHGTAAADPSKPETGDNVAIAMVLIANGATIASSQTTFDKRVMTHPPAKQYKYRTADLSPGSTTLADVAATSGNIAFPVAASTDYEINIDAYITAVGTPGSGGWKFAFTFPSSPTYVQVYYDMPYQNSDATNVYDTARAAQTPTSGTAFFSQTAYNSAVAAGMTTGVGHIRFIVRNGSTAGTVTFQAAQNTAAGTSTIGEIFASCELITAA